MNKRQLWSERQGATDVGLIETHEWSDGLMKHRAAGASWPWRGLLLIQVLSFATLWCSSEHADGQERGNLAAGRRFSGNVVQFMPRRQPSFAARHQLQCTNFCRRRAHDVDTVGVADSVSADATCRDA